MKTVDGVLTPFDKRYWITPDQVNEFVVSQIPDGARVLEIGPGDEEGGRPRFKRADTFVDCRPMPNIGDKLVLCNVAEEPLPFPDKSFDFIYCRHVLEDLYNPFLCLKEMNRVGKAGYIETPSPLAELCRGVDIGDQKAMCHRGYYHHHFYCWVHRNELRFLSKYGFLEYAMVDDAAIIELMRAGPKYWNTYYLWRDELKWNYRQNVAHFHLWRDMPAMLCNALKECQKSVDAFWADLPKESTMNNFLPQVGSKTKELKLGA